MNHGVKQGGPRLGTAVRDSHRCKLNRRFPVHIPRSVKIGTFFLSGVLLLCRPAPFSRGGENKAGPFTTFKDITTESGLAAFKIVCGDKVTEFLIDVNGEGAAFFDYDNDGYQDIYLVNGSSRTLEKSTSPPHDYLLHNNGDSTFTDVTAKAHLGDTAWGGAVAVGDYNNDGYLDLYVTNYGPNRLYRNNGDGTFTDVAKGAGVEVRWDFPKWSMGAAFGDIDNDGYLDLYVTNFAKFYYQPDRPAPSPTSPCKMKSVPIACAPDQYEGSQGLLYHNNRNGTFTDILQTLLNPPGSHRRFRDGALLSCFPISTTRGTRIFFRQTIPAPISSTLVLSFGITVTYFAQRVKPPG
jgi:enediyne biosynthesis protein E4